MAYVINRVGASGSVANILVTGLVQSGNTVTAVTPSGGSKSAVWGSIQKTNPAWRGLPSGYTQVEYITSSGTQYVNTGVACNNIRVISFTRQITSLYSGYMVQADGAAESSYRLTFGAYRYSSSYSPYWIGRFDSTGYGGTSGTVADTNEHQFELNFNTGESLLDDIAIATNLPSSSSCTLNFFVCARNRLGTGVDCYITGNTGEYLIYGSDDALLCDLVPCKNSSDVYGFYDKVADTFLGSSGSDAFTGGSEVSQYITTSGWLLSDLTEYGTYTITATDGTQTATETCLVDAATDYEVEMSYQLTFQYVKWVITKIRSANATLQASEFKLIDSSDTEHTWTTETITASLTGNTNEGIDMLIDNSTSTKYCTAQWGGSQTGTCTIVITLLDSYTLDDFPKYAYYTANDYSARDPISWTMSVSADGTNYTTVSTVSDASITTSRNVIAGTWTMAEEWYE